MGVDVPARIRQRLLALPEAAMREAVLVEALAALPAGDAVRALADLAASPPVRDRAHLVAAQTVAGALERIPYALRQELYETAKAAELPAVARLFLETSPHLAQVQGEPRPPEPEQYIPGTGKTLTLGERKALARGGRRDMVSALLRDPDAAVIKNLLENPRLTEKDVVALACRRPVRGEVLRTLFASKWTARYHVRRALVLNPYTPRDLAVRLVGTLATADLRLIAADPNLAEPVRAQARSLF